jgi:hypothetical protein
MGAVAPTSAAGAPKRVANRSRSARAWRETPKVKVGPSALLVPVIAEGAFAVYKRQNRYCDWRADRRFFRCLQKELDLVAGGVRHLNGGVAFLLE